jgi:hypothetical protein
MAPANESPAFPSVGARARFTPQLPYSRESEVARHAGEDCAIASDVGMGGVKGEWWRVTFSDGISLDAFWSELSPLPAAPTNSQSAPSSSEIRTSVAPLQEDTK